MRLFPNVLGQIEKILTGSWQDAEVLLRRDGRRVVEAKGLVSVQREKHARDRDVWQQLKRELERAKRTIDDLRDERRRMQRASEKAERTIAELESKAEALSGDQKQIQADHRLELKALRQELEQAKNTPR
jgi:septal ring factor EnvC (AmiA/AmiB activator)